MRVLHLVHQYLPAHVGGTELYTQAVARGQAARGHQVSIFCRDEGPCVGLEQRTEDGVALFSACSGSLTAGHRFRATFGDPHLERSFYQALEKSKPDLVHIEHLMGLPAALVRLLQRRRIPFVVTLWDYWWVCANAQLLTNYDEHICSGPSAFMNCARCALARAALPGFWPAIPPVAATLALRNRVLAGIVRSASRLIAPTEFVRQWYAEHGIPAESLVVIAPALDGVQILPESAKDQHRPVRFLYIGGLSWQKGVHVLLQAASGIAGDTEVWIGGDEKADPAYVARLKAIAAGNVRFLGRLEREQVWAALAEADIVVVPTLWYETFSFIISESFTAGRPVIASRLGPLADRIADGVNGLLVPPGDIDAWRLAMQRLVDEPHYLADLRAGVEPPLTLDEHLAKLEALYTQVTTRL